MRSETRAQVNAYANQIATLNGVTGNPAVKFTVEPTIQQKLQERIQQSADFLKRINFELVIDQEAEKVGIGTTRPIASRTNTAAGKRRIATDPTNTFYNGRYRCEQTNFDRAVPYSKLDKWRHKPEFQTLLRDVIVKQQARDVIMMGWNGLEVARDTDHVAFPLLQDVNKGWLYHIRTDAPDRVMDTGLIAGDGPKAIYLATGAEVVDAAGSNAATAGADYVNLDHLVHDLTELVDEWHRDDSELVVIVGRNLLQDKFANIIATAGDTATEMEAVSNILTLPKQIGGKRAIVVPFFPANSVLITRLDNISIYEQEGSRRRLFRDEPEYDQVANYESGNLAFVVEDYGLTALADNIVMAKKPG